jgi:hypothetical protein
MSSLLADQYRNRYEPKCGVSANENSCAHGAQINFADLTLRLAEFSFKYSKAESGSRFLITNISANSTPKSERLER